MRAGSIEHVSVVAMLSPRTPLHLGRSSRVQRYRSSMHRAMEEDSLMTRYDDDCRVLFCARVAWVCFVCLLLCKEVGSSPVALQLLRGGI